MTLTGRVFLWQHAIQSIGENPILGVGFTAYWQPGNPGAEELWAYGHVGKGGFHFHNTYLQVGVDLGLVGLFTLLAILLVMGKRAVSAIVSPQPSYEVLFAIAVFLLLLLRTPLEVEMFTQFELATILLCLAWSYLRVASTAGRNTVARS
jgi:exopolysaccharide production protein ExoQ